MKINRVSDIPDYIRSGGDVDDLKAHFLEVAEYVSNNPDRSHYDFYGYSYPFTRKCPNCEVVDAMVGKTCSKCGWTDPMVFVTCPRCNSYIRHMKSDRCQMCGYEGEWPE